MVDFAIKIGDFVKDRYMGLTWKVVDQDDDGMTYIERNDVRSFVTIWNLELVARKSSQAATDAS